MGSTYHNYCLRRFALQAGKDVNIFSDITKLPVDLVECFGILGEVPNQQFRRFSLDECFHSGDVQAPMWCGEEYDCSNG